MNTTLVKIKERLKLIRVKPIRNSAEHTLWSYYFGLTDFERTEYDCLLRVDAEGKPASP